jgi:FdhD protein
MYDRPMGTEQMGERAEQQRLQITRIEDGRVESAIDAVAREQAMQLLVDSKPLAILMRTPGSDLELALGLLHAEGVVHRLEEVASVTIAPSGQRGLDQIPLTVQVDPLAENVVDIHLYQPLPEGAIGWQRSLPSSSACGICGAATLEALQRFQPPVRGDRIWEPDRIFELPELLAGSQRTFQATGGLHAAGLLPWSRGGLEVAEDVGRHNAVDKLVGRSLMAGRMPLTDSCLLVSGRAGFEIVQKAAAAQISVVASISAPSSLAVQVAEATGVTLIGFLRGGRCNVYSHPERLGARAGGGAARHGELVP